MAYKDKTSIPDPNVLRMCRQAAHSPTVATAEASSIPGYAALYVSVLNLPSVT
jgi:hypothetical protein